MALVSLPNFSYSSLSALRRVYFRIHNLRDLLRHNKYTVPSLRLNPPVYLSIVMRVGLKATAGSIYSSPYLFSRLEIYSGRRSARSIDVTPALIVRLM